MTPEYQKNFFYQIKTGTYNREKQDKEITENPKKYYSNKSFFPAENKKISPKAINYNLSMIKKIKKECEDKGVKLYIIAAPTYITELKSFPEHEFTQYIKDIAKITDFWDFSGYNSCTNNNKFFYDSVHYRQFVGNMIIARVFSDKNVEIPKDFGMYVTKDNINEDIKLHHTKIISK